MSIGPPELLLILVIVLIVFGAGKLPQVFNSLGRGIREFREASEGRDQTTGAVPPPAEVGTPTAPIPPPAPPYTAPEVPPPAYTPPAPPPPPDEPKSGA